MKSSLFPPLCYSPSTKDYRTTPYISLGSLESVVERQEGSFAIKDTKRNRKKQYRCDKCLKVFNRPSALKTHMYTHTGEKPHVCSSIGCNRRFSVISNLRRHLKVHNKPKNRSRLSPEERKHNVMLLMGREQSEKCTTDYSDQLNSQGTHYVDTTLYESIELGYNLELAENPVNSLDYFDQSLSDQIPAPWPAISTNNFFYSSSLYH